MLENIGDKYKNFILKKATNLPEIQCILRELEHEPTGAAVMHIANDDPENVFCLSFQTTPDSSNGVAHILEHTVLCGSEKFPVKDPFFAMMRRSLNTFMNALTGADYTCYPAATQVPKDFYNLLGVYLDAVFRPKLKELSFMQEGHRLEFTDPTNPRSPLEFKGIVFNEMKGALANPDSRLGEAFGEALFPDVTYGVNSGGDPKVIPQLTYQQLLDFHKKYYNPCRCVYYFYGNLPLEGHLDFIESHALRGVTREDPLPKVPKQPRFSRRASKSIGYPYSSEDDPLDQSLIGFGWLTCDILDQETLLALSVLSIVLLGTDAAPLKLALLKSGLCKQVSAHLEDEMSEVPVVITLKGCKAEDASRLEAVLFDTLRKVVSEGIPSELVENAMHQIEFHRSEIAGNSYPYGLILFFRSALLKQHGGCPEDGLLIHSLCDRLRQKYYQEPHYFVSLIKRYFLENPHFVSLTAFPDPSLEEKEREEEQGRLRRLHQDLSEKQVETIVRRAQELEEFQKRQEEADLDVLPKLTLEDVPKDTKDYPLVREKAGSLDIFYHECFTNKIIYADLVFPLPRIEEKHLSLLKLFTLLMPQMGCGGRSYEKNLEYIQAHTGGVGAAERLNIQVEDQDTFIPYTLIQGKALYRKADRLFTLLHDMATATDFSDRPRIKEVVVKHFTLLQSSMNRNALSYAKSLASSGLSMSCRIGNAWGGLEYYNYIKNLVENFDNKVDLLLTQLNEMKERVLGLAGPHLIITCDREMYDQLKSEGFYGLRDLAGKPFAPWKADYSIAETHSQGKVISSPVAFIAKVLKTLPYEHPDTPALSLAANLFDNLTLHPRIREQGGAYGGGSMNHSLSGNFCFYSYRDPNLSSTLAAFEEAVKRVIDQNFKDSDLEEAKLEMIQGLDSPVSPGNRGHIAYTWLREGKTLQKRHTYREKILGLKKEEVAEAVKRHLLHNLHEAPTVVFAGRELLERENGILLSKGLPALKIGKI